MCIRDSIQAVEHGQQVGEQAFVGELAQLLHVAAHALALVFQVGTFAQHVGAGLFQFLSLIHI